MECVRVQVEATAGIPFAFSLIFHEDSERKHMFSVRSESQVTEWVTAINSCRYNNDFFLTLTVYKFMLYGIYWYNNTLLQYILYYNLQFQHEQSSAQSFKSMSLKDM